MIVTDNHAAHHSRLVRSYVEENDINLVYMPPYSCAFSPIERVWALFKRAWATQLSKIRGDYDARNLNRDI